MRTLPLGIMVAFGLVVGMPAVPVGEAAEPEPKAEGPGAKPARAQNEKEKAATAAAEAWLKLVDQGKYADSWKEAAELFKGAMKPEQWEQALNGMRKPLGKVLSRKVRKTTYSKSLPGAPDGEYVTIQFDTSFENKKGAVETVTPMLEKDGTWRVAGYFMK